MLGVTINNMDSIFWVIFIALFIIALFIFYVIYYRGVALRERLSLYTIQLFPQSKPAMYGTESKYMECEGGYALVRIRVDNVSELLIYQFLVGGQLNMMRLLVHVQHGVKLSDGIYGRGYVSRECKSHQLYADFKAVSDLDSMVNYLEGAVSVIEVNDGSAYCYYHLNSFFGSYPIRKVLELIDNK